MNYKSSVFPNNNTTLAYYDQFGQFIKLCYIDGEDFKNLRPLALDSYKSIWEYSIFMHELTHWIDHQCSLWGQQNLVYLFNAINARATHKVDEFWRIKYYYDIRKTESQHSYYTHIIQPNKRLDKIPWKIRYATSSRFDLNGRTNEDKPIFYAFIETENNDQIARIPITVSALLEARAICNEFYFRYDSLINFENEQEKNAAFDELDRELFDTVYSPDLLLYSIIAHLTGFIASSRNLEYIYTLSSVTSNVSLNFPDSLLSQIKCLSRNNSSIKGDYEKLLRNKDLGFIYYNLIENYSLFDDKQEIELENILKASNLPNSEEFKKLVIKEMNGNLNKLIPGPFYDIAKATIEKGIEVFNKSHLDLPITHQLKFIDKNFTPNIFFRDSKLEYDKTKVTTDTIQHLIDKKDKTFQDYYVLYDYTEEYLIDFYQACGI